MVQWFKSLPSMQVLKFDPSQGTKIPHYMGQQSPHLSTTEPAHSGACTTTRESPFNTNKEPVLCNKNSVDKSFCLFVFLTFNAKCLHVGSTEHQRSNIHCQSTQKHSFCKVTITIFSWIYL